MIDRRQRFLEWLDRQRLERSETYDCPYLPGRRARQYGFATERLDGELHQALQDRGFRRSGPLFYGMDCPSCRRCVPLRVPTAAFRPSRSQRRTMRRNRDVEVRFGAPALAADTVALYRRYLAHQHPGSPQDDSEEGLRAWLYDPVVPSLEARYLVDGRLVGVSLLDVCADSLSAVYHFFEPAERRRRIGVYSVLAEIDHARALGLPYYYLGYWVEGAPTMHYKADYRPHELLLDGAWRPAGDGGGGGGGGPTGGD